MPKLIEKSTGKAWDIPASDIQGAIESGLYNIPEGTVVPTVDPRRSDNLTSKVSVEDLTSAEASGLKPETHAGALVREDEARREREHGGVGGVALTAGESLLDAASLGGYGVLSDLALGDGYTDKRLERRQVNPGTAIAGDVVGSVAPVVLSGGSGAAGVVARKMPVAILDRGAASLAAKGGGSVLRSGVVRGLEGGVANTLHTASHLAVTDQLSLEQGGSALSSAFLFGGGIGGAAGALGKAAEKGLVRSAKHLDEFAQTRATAASASSPEAVADEIAAARLASKEEKPWLATENKETRKVLLKANRAITHLTDNPKGLAQKPWRALDALQREEQALSRIVDEGPALRQGQAAAPPKPSGKLKEFGDDDRGKAIKHVRKAKAGMSPEHQELLANYSYSDFNAVNAALRETPEKAAALFDDTAEALHQRIAGIDSALDQAPPTGGFVTWRSVNVSSDEMWDAFRVGKEISDPAYASSSLRRSVADNFVNSDRAVMMRVEVPKGSKLGAFIQESEQEFLFKRGTKFHVVDEALEQHENGVTQLKVLTLRPQVAGAAPPSQRIASLDSAEKLLERNRALQAQLQALEPGGAAEKSLSRRIGEAAVGRGVGAAVGAVAGGPVGAVLGSELGDVVKSLVFDRLAKSSGAIAKRTSEAINTFLDVSRPVAKAAPIAATRVLEGVRFAPETPPRRPQAPTKDPLLMAFRAREAEIYSQTTMGPDGKHKMKPAARAALAKRLTPVRVLSPMAADRLETLGARRVEYLADHAPKRPDAMARVVGPERWQPSAFQLAEFARRVAALEDPAATYERMVDGTLTKEDAECMQAVYPEMFKAGRDEIIRRLPELRASLPYQRRVMLSLFTGVPVDPAMDPMVLQVLQQAYVEEPGTEGGTQAPTPKPAFGSVSKPEPTPGQERSSGRTSIA